LDPEINKWKLNERFPYRTSCKKDYWIGWSSDRAKERNDSNFL